MDFEQFINVQVVGGCLGVALIRFMWSADEALKPELKTRLGNWIAGVKVTEEDEVTESLNWGEAFVKKWDRTFQTGRYYRPSYRRSFIATAFCLLLFGIMTMLTGRFDSPEPRSGDTIFISVLPILIFVILITNFISDYFSVWVTRFFISKIRGWRIFPIIVSDLVVTLALFLLPLMIIIFIDTRSMSIDFISFAFVAELILKYSIDAILYFFGGSPVFFQGSEVVNFQGFAPVLLSASFLTTLMTSLWLWLYLIAAFLGRFVMSIPTVGEQVAKVLNVTETPLRAIGIVMGVSLIVITNLLMMIAID